MTNTIDFKPKLLFIVDQEREKAFPEDTKKLVEKIDLIQPYFSVQVVSDLFLKTDYLKEKVAKSGFKWVFVPEFHRNRFGKSSEFFLASFLDRTSESDPQYERDPLRPEERSLSFLDGAGAPSTLLPGLQSRVGTHSFPSAFLCLNPLQQKPMDLARIIESFIRQSIRGGISSFFPINTPIYCENWYEPDLLGARLEKIFQLPFMDKPSWSQKKSEIETLFLTLHQIAFEKAQSLRPTPEGPSTHPQAPSAYFQIAVDPQFLAFRLFLPEDPDPIKHSSDLTKRMRPFMGHADVIRIHSILDTENSNSPSLEWVVGLFPSLFSSQLQRYPTHWIETLQLSQLTDLPFQAPGPNAPDLKLLMPQVIQNQRSGLRRIK